MCTQHVSAKHSCNDHRPSWLSGYSPPPIPTNSFLPPSKILCIESYSEESFIEARPNVAKGSETSLSIQRQAKAFSLFFFYQSTTISSLPSIQLIIKTSFYLFISHLCSQLRQKMFRNALRQSSRTASAALRTNAPVRGAPVSLASRPARAYASDAKAAPTEVSSILEQRIRGVQEEAGLAETGRVLSVG